MLKNEVHDFWQQESCGEVYAAGRTVDEQLQSQARRRYELEPYIPAFARFAEARDRRVLEIGVGMGADHFEWARQSPRSLTGIDVTRRALDHTRNRFALHDLPSRLARADAEHLPFHDNSFELVYSWGVLHHSPDTERAIGEVHRVLAPGGIARVMIYHHRSIVGALLWVRFGLLRGRPFRSLTDLYANHLESPGTKAYSTAECRRLFRSFRRVTARPLLSFADLLQGNAGDRHGGRVMMLARRLWPRWLIRRLCPSCGLYLLVEATK
jgi:ubiquinone/menaquinone biosynthesis C-methylase UbiE